MIDIVTVVFRDELDVLRQQAQSLDLYCRHIGASSIYVFVNDDDAVAQEIDPAWWGSLQSLVRIIPASAFSTSFHTTGWVSQQAIKLMASGMSYNTWSMILDAKTIFVHELELAKLFDQRGRIQMGIMDVYPVFEASRNIVNDFFKIDLPKQIGPGGVPFFVHNATVRAMIATVETQSGQAFPQWFQDHGRLTEFILYSGFVHATHGNFNTLYNTQTQAVPVCNVCHSEVESFDRKFTEMQTSMVVSVHRNAWSKLDSERQQRYLDFLVTKGIK